MGKIIDRIMGRTAPDEPEEEQDIEALRERKREILRAAGLDISYATDEILDHLKIVKEPFHFR